ncbi:MULTISPECIES: bifunctional 2-polyprenyl-6-hydroxyphenol methylase/3-demethylubiquinol 3-O-methyltransferase UbiG [unclassified Cupriavidus]|uniref:class I SAM-dependent methyltransferase n=1 Tax=unclassified Cupriavidus TaxID=2640874 RepID=UPI00040B7CAD|nr:MULTISPECIES: class I SAM-dependent methyltransferase [unclassified Cupriavidus]MBP0633993.1 class I SAM-dependent methyltransferase [Cupriavidus sp. AcVe19-6a]
MSYEFYRAFEDRHRGSRTQIKERQRSYLPFIRPLLTFGFDIVALDLGCGRGEWLELLTEEGFLAKGVDLDDGMLEACHVLGLNAQKEDALSALRSIPDESLSVVSAFHVVEHLDFECLAALVSEAFRVLRPGGILILETPNPENIIVAGCNFYLDPSHKNPIPPELLGFVVEYSGFSRIKKIRLQESEILRDQNVDVHLLDVLGGVSPDYGIVAQKVCDGDLSKLFDDAFNADYGLTLAVLASRFENRLTNRNNEFEDQLQSLGKNVALLDRRIEKFDQHNQQARAHSHQVELHFQQVELDIRQVRSEMQQISTQLQAVYCSTSWRITAPLRRVATFARNAKRGSKEKARRFLQRCAIYADRRPLLRRLVGRALDVVPSVKQRLIRIIVGAPIQSTAEVPTTDVPVTEVRMNVVPVEDDGLTPRARKFYVALKAALESRDKGRH